MSSFPLTFIFFRGVGIPPIRLCRTSNNNASDQFIVGDPIYGGFPSQNPAEISGLFCSQLSPPLFRGHGWHVHDVPVPVISPHFPEMPYNMSILPMICPWYLQKIHIEGFAIDLGSLEMDSWVFPNIIYIYVYGGIELYYRYLIISPMREPIGWLNGYHLTIDYLMYLFVFYHAHVHYYFHS